MKRIERTQCVVYCVQLFNLSHFERHLTVQVKNNAPSNTTRFALRPYSVVYKNIRGHNGKTTDFKRAGIFCERCNNSSHHQSIWIITLSTLWTEFIAQFASIKGCGLWILYDILWCISCRLCEVDGGLWHVSLQTIHNIAYSECDSHSFRLTFIRISF